MNPPVHERRPALKVNKALAERFGIDPDQPDPPRETVKVDIASLPDPPGAVIQAIVPGKLPPLDAETAIVHVITEEMDELAVRLERFGVNFDTSRRQQMIDTAMALLAGVSPGGTIAGH